MKKLLPFFVISLCHFGLHAKKQEDVITVAAEKIQAMANEYSKYIAHFETNATYEKNKKPKCLLSKEIESGLLDWQQEFKKVLKEQKEVQEKGAAWYDIFGWHNKKIMALAEKAGEHEEEIKKHKKVIAEAKKFESALLKARTEDGENLLHLYFKQLEQCEKVEEVADLAKKHEPIRRRIDKARLGLAPNKQGITPNDAFCNHQKRVCSQEDGDLKKCIFAAGYENWLTVGGNWKQITI